MICMIICAKINNAKFISHLPAKAVFGLIWSCGLTEKLITSGTTCSLSVYLFVEMEMSFERGRAEG